MTKLNKLREELKQQHEALEIFNKRIDEIVKAIEDNVEYKKITQINLDRLKNTREIREDILDSIIRINIQLNEI